MQIGIIGLGRMGMNMARRWNDGGHDVVVFNRTPEKVKQMETEGAVGATSLEDMVGKLNGPRLVWLMLPIGGIVDDHIDQLKELLSEGDVIIDGGNSYFKDDIVRAKDLKKAGIHYVDAGVSGGIWGHKVGYCTMLGGEKEIIDHMKPLLDTLAPTDGWLYCGETGAGHFVKMTHNGIEYALMEAYAEGFELLGASRYGEGLDFHKVSHLWNQGSVVRSWLLELLEDAFAEDPRLESIEGYVEDSGEGRWTVEQAVELGVSATGIAHSLFKRFQSRQENVFSDKVLAALRNQFGGHAIAKKGDNKRSKNAGAGGVIAANADDNKEIPQ